MTNSDLETILLVFVWQRCFISFLGVSYIQFSETVQHHDKLYEFQLGFVKHGAESERNYCCQMGQTQDLHYI